MVIAVAPAPRQTKTLVHAPSTVGLLMASGICMINTHKRNMTPSDLDASGTLRLVKKLNAESKKPAITTYDKNKCAGIHAGISVMT